MVQKNTSQHLKKLQCLAQEKVQGELKKRLREKQSYDWSLNAREKQKAPEGDWRVWLILAGRGFGKTRTGAETIRRWVMEGKCRRLALLGATEEEARHIMVEGESGLLNIHPPKERPKYEPTHRRLTWPNGAIATIYSAENYDQLRGPQFDGAWVDELAKFRYGRKAWDQLNFCLRLGEMPRILVTTTPRPTPLIRGLLTQEGKDVVVTRGTTFENADHLSASFLSTIEAQFKGTNLGRQELMGEVIYSTQRALWAPEILERYRVKTAPELCRIVVAIDPAVTSHQKSDETGMVVAGLGQEGHGYVLEDLSGRFEATQWAKRAIKAYYGHQADRIVAEVNQGGELVEKMIRTQDPRVSYKALRATRGKVTRAEPIAALYEQGKIHHVGAGLGTLEEQMLTYIPGESKKSPDRLDALVWALTELLLDRPSPGRIWAC